MTVLVVAAHPDDEVLGCGGTIARLAAAGQAVDIAILGEGITSRYTERDLADEGQVDLLRDQSRRAAEILGARGRFVYNLPDNRFDTVPLLEVVKIIEELIERLQPRVIYTHAGSDLNVDHAIVHRAVVTATRPMPGCCVKEVYACEVPSATDWAFGQFHPVFRPNVFVDVTSTIETKIQALCAYEGEVRSYPHPRSPEALRAAAQRWGSVVGVAHAEAFQLIRSLQ